MAAAAKPDLTPELLTTTVSIGYTVSGSKTGFLIGVLIHNLDTTSHVVNLWLVPSGGSVTNANKIFGRAVQALDSISWKIMQYMEAGATLRHSADADNLVSIRNSAVET